MTDLVAPSVEAARVSVNIALVKSTTPSLEAARQQFVDALKAAEKRARQHDEAKFATPGKGGRDSAFVDLHYMDRDVKLSLLFADMSPLSSGVLADPKKWFDVTVASLIREREAQFYASMTNAFRTELQKQVSVVFIWSVCCDDSEHAPNLCCIVSLQTHNDR
jgi:hypothetical protein